MVRIAGGTFRAGSGEQNLEQILFHRVRDAGHATFVEIIPERAVHRRAILGFAVLELQREDEKC
jgi:hypothetical protein